MTMTEQQRTVTTSEEEEAASDGDVHSSSLLPTSPKQQPDDEKQHDVPNIEPTPFVTMSDVLQSLNKSLIRTMDGGGSGGRRDITTTITTTTTTTEEEEADDDDDGQQQEEEEEEEEDENALLVRSSSGGDEGQPRFELQKRFPDGTTRRATRSELAGANMQTKLEQAATYVESLPTLTSKLEWAQQQRLAGNSLYQNEQYQEAIDVYLTCLVVVARDYDAIDSSSTAANDDSPTTDGQQQAQQQQQPQQQILLCFCYVMNNLAQCAMKLARYKKAQEFCTLGLTRIQEKTTTATTGQYSSSLSSSTTTTSTGEIIQLQVAKLYYKRGKSRRLKGEYEHAKADLQQALEHLNSNMMGTKSKDDEAENEENADEQQLRIVRQSSRQGVEHELKLVQKAQVEEQRNEQRVKQSLRKVLRGGQSRAADRQSDMARSSPGADETSITKSVASSSSSSSPQPLLFSTNNHDPAPTKAELLNTSCSTLVINTNNSG